LSLIVGLPLTGVVLFRSLSNLQDSARFKLARHWDDAEAYRFRRSNSDWLGDYRPVVASFHSTESNNTHVVETALRALNDYGVFGPDEWRRRDDVRVLPAADREDLELWLMEQAYRYCQALDDRPDSRVDWQRARDLLERLRAATPLQAFTALSHRLGVKLGLEAPADPPVRPASAERKDRAAGQRVPAAVPWLDEYLMGVAAECDLDSQRGDEDETTARPGTVRPASEPSDSDPPSRARSRAIRRALDHYSKVLALRPDSYWGHYRAAATSYVLGSFAETAEHLERCLKRRPDNPTLRGHWAACLAWLERFPAALQECNRALDGSPELAELYRTRAFIRAASGQTAGLAEDIQHFELLSRLLPRAFWSRGTAPGGDVPEPSPVPATRRVLEFPTAVDFVSRLGHQADGLEGASQNLEVDPEEINARAVLASTIRDAGEFDLAAFEFGKILILEPDQIEVRMSQAILAIETRRFEAAHREFDAVLTNPGLIEHVQKEPKFIRRFHHASRQYCLNGKFQEGRAIARRALDLAITLRLPPDESHYYLARAYAISARTDPQFIAKAADQLYWVFVAHPLNHGVYARDPAFKPVRAQVDEELLKKPDPTEVYRRRISMLLAQAH